MSFQPGVYALPSDFNNPANAGLRYNGTSWSLTEATVESIDFTPTTIYYVDYQNGSDSNDGLASAEAFKSLYVALDAAVSTGVATEVVLLDEWIGFLSVLRTSWTVTNNLKVRSGHSSGRTIITQKRESYEGTFDWSDSGDGTFRSTTNQADHPGSFDGKYLDDYNGATPMKAASSSADCVATPGSFYYAGGTMQVHMVDGREPDSDWLYCSGESAAKPRFLMDSSAGVLILEGLHCYINNAGVREGGLGGRSQQYESPFNTAKVGVKDCLSYGSQDGFNFYSFETSIYENCIARYNRHDGFNHHQVISNNDADYMTVYENGCKAFDQGWDDWKSQPALGVSNNPTTAHDEMSILRVNGEYKRGFGPVVADVNSVDSWNIAVDAERPNLSSASVTNAVYYHQGTTTPDHPSRMRLIDCTGTTLTSGSASTVYTLSEDGAEADIGYVNWLGEAPLIVNGSADELSTSILELVRSMTTATDNRSHTKIFATDQVLGVAVDSFGPKSSIEFKLGTQVKAKFENALIYVYANEAIASGTSVSFGASFTASSDASGNFTSLYALASGEYGWVYGDDESAAAAVAVDNYLLESGDNLLMEDGSLYVLE